MKTTISQLAMVCGALLGLLTVASGALAAHLPDRDFAAGGREMLRSAVQMQGWHATALLAAGLLGLHRDSTWLRLAVCAFLLGIACFCLGVWTLALGNPAASVLAHLAPFGGSTLMLGWALLAVAAWRA